MPTNYAPIKVSDFSSKDLNLVLQGTMFTALPGQATTHDFLITQDSLIMGAFVIVLDAALGDKIKCEVVDVNNVLGYGPGVVLGQYAVDWYMNPRSAEQLNFSAPYPAKLVTGLYLRVVYASVGITSVPVIVNYNLHKILW